MVKSDVQINLLKLSRDELRQAFDELELKPFRATQVWDWCYKKGAREWQQMTNLSKDLRERLSSIFTLQSMSVDHVQRSSDGTVKSRFLLEDGHAIESVLIPVPDENRYTVCVSSQVGCSLSCSFCATGMMDRKRNLYPYEIYDQVSIVDRQCQEYYGHHITNIVFMGMGEPLLAYAPVLQGIRLILLNEYWNLSAKRITVSTAGIAKMIRKLADEDIKVKLALSLHAADDAKRDSIMAINETNNLQVLLDALKYHYEKKKERLTYEYILFDGFNDTPQDAVNLAKLCSHFPVKVNIIEYNPVEGVDFQKPSEKRLNSFIQALLDRSVYASVRRSRGKDIDAACGQLANK